MIEGRSYIRVCRDGERILAQINNILVTEPTVFSLNQVGGVLFRK